MERPSVAAWARISALAFALACGVAAAGDLTQTLDEAERLLRAGRAAEAAALLAPLEEEHAGVARFDYLLGSALLTAGQPDQASLALERAVRTDPMHGAAHLDLARAYELMGDDLRARAEFQVAEKLNPPPAARRVIAEHLAALAARERAQQGRLMVFAEVGAGHDGNVNNATRQSDVAIPALGDAILTLNPSNVQVADRFASVSAGLESEVPLTGALGWTVAAHAQQKTNARHGEFDLGAADLSTGVSLTGDGQVAEINVSAARVYLGGRLNRTIDGGAINWRKTLDARTELIANLQQLRYRFPDPELAANSFDQTSASLGASRLGESGKSVWSASLIWGHEHDTHERSDGPKDIAGVQLAGRWQWDDKTEVHWDAGWLANRYGRVNPAFERLRRDQELQLGVGLIYHWSREYSLRPSLDYVRHHSNLPVFDFRDLVLAVKLRYEFNRQPQ